MMKIIWIIVLWWSYLEILNVDRSRSRYIEAFLEEQLQNNNKLVINENNKKNILFSIDMMLDGTSVAEEYQRTKDNNKYLLT